MKVLFVDPGFGEESFHTFGNSHWSSVIHHGLCSLSAVLKSCGYAVQLLDIRQLRGWEHFRAELQSVNPDVIGLTMRTCDFNMVNKVARIAKTLYPKVPIILGGVHPTVMTHEVLPNDDYDYIVTGEGELTLPKILESIAAGRSMDRVIVGEKPDLNTLPFDDRELYPYRVTLNLVSYPGTLRPPMVTIIGSRGCPFNCTYCAPHAKTMFGKKIRFRSPEHVIEELKELRQKYQFRSIKFYDYSFTLDPKWVYEFCDLYERNGFTADILAQSRADLLCRDEALIKRMKQVGLKLMLIGFESGSQKVLDALKKGATVEQNLEAARLLKRNGVMVGGSFMLGSPDETKEDVRATVDLVKKMKPHYVSVSFFTPCPGSELWDYCQKHGLSLLKSYDELVTYAPSSPRIIGIDYEYLNSAVEEIMGSRFGGKLVGKLIKFVYVRTKKMLRLRHFLIYWYSKWVGSRWYRLLVQRDAL